VANEITVTIDVNNKKALKALDGFVKSTKGVEKKVVKSFSRMDAAVGSFVGNLAATAVTKAARGIIDLGRAAINQASKIEDLATQFETLTQSADKAQKLIADLADFASKTPFKLENLAESSKLLLAFGKSTEDVLPPSQHRGDVAAGAGTDLIERAATSPSCCKSGNLET